MYTSYPKFMFKYLVVVIREYSNTKKPLRLSPTSLPSESIVPVSQDPMFLLVSQTTNSSYN